MRGGLTRWAMAAVPLGILAVALAAGCSASGGAGGGGAPAAKKTIRILQGKIEITDNWKRLAAAYEKEHPDVELVIDTVGGGLDYIIALNDRFVAGNPPDLFMDIGYTQLTPWLDQVVDLSGEPWVADLLPGVAAPVTRGGRIYGFPFAIEGFAFVYNKTLFAKAGIRELPRSLGELEQACLKLEATGIQPFSNGYAEWWVLGNHYLNLLLASQPDPGRFVDDWTQGRVRLADNPLTNAWLDLLDLSVRHDLPDPTHSGDYASSLAALLAGKVAMIQQGNWIQPELDRMEEPPDLGFLPMPLAGPAGNAGAASAKPRMGLMSGVPTFLMVSKNSPSRDEALELLRWLNGSELGRRAYAQGLCLIPPYKSFAGQSLTGLNRLLMEEWRAGRTLGWEFPRLPLGATELIGDALMKYIEGKLGRPALLAAMDAATAGQARRQGR